MRKLIKIITGLSLTLLPFMAMGQINSVSPTPAFTTNYLITQAANVVLLTNACKIAQVQVLGGSASSVTVNLYDNNATNATYTNASFTNLVVYPTNYVNTTISPLTGVTNIYTNAELAEVTTVQPTSTNALPYRTFISPAGVMATYSVNMIQSRGILITTTSTNGSIMVTYRLND